MKKIHLALKDKLRYKIVYHKQKLIDHPLLTVQKLQTTNPSEL